MPVSSHAVARAGVLAVVALVASIGTTRAHAGEIHDDASTGGWAGVGWYGVAAVVALVVVLGLTARRRAEASTVMPDDGTYGRHGAEK